MILALAMGVAMPAAKAQDDLGPPPKAPTKKSALPPPVEDSLDPPAPKQSGASSASKPAKKTIDFPGVDLPDESQPQAPKAAARVKQAPISTMELPAPSTLDAAKESNNASEIPGQIALPITASEKKGVVREPLRPATTPPSVSRNTDVPAALNDAASPTSSVTISAPVAAESTRPKKTAVPKELVSNAAIEENAIPAPGAARRSNQDGPVAESESPQKRRERRSTIEVKKKPAVEKETKDEIIQASAVLPAPKPQDRFELVQPRVPTYDVIHSKSDLLRTDDAVATVYETADEMLNNDGRVIQVGATSPDPVRSTVESYPVKIWKIDGWETFAELARMEYREESLAAALAKYNRSARRAADPLPAGLKVRLPPKWVLERSGTTVARRPAPIKTEFTAPPATSVQAQPGGRGVVASSGRNRPGALVKSNDASPLPSERTPVPDDGKVFVVNEKDMTLYKVAKRVLGDGSKWQRIYDLNRDRLSSSQSELKIGTRLKLPDDSMLR